MSDLSLWNRLKSGDHEALEKIYRTYFDMLYDYGKRFSMDESMVEDCIQELFIEIWNRREYLASTDSIKPYLFLSLRRKIIKDKQKNRKSNDVELGEYHFDAVLDIESILIKNEYDSDKKMKLQKAFDALSDRQKEIIYLKYYADIDYDSIAEQMDMNYQSARNLLHRAIKTLTKHLVPIGLLLFISEYIFKNTFFTY